MAGSNERPLGPEVSLVSADSPTKTGEKASSEPKPPLVAIKEEETESITSVSPPDGGWGWWVVFASFMIHIVGESKLPFTCALNNFFSIFSRRNNLLLWHFPRGLDWQVQRWQGLCLPYSIYPGRHHPWRRYADKSEKNQGSEHCDAIGVYMSIDSGFIGILGQLHNDPEELRAQTDSKQKNSDEINICIF